jgi:hypothetical protein
MLSAFRPDDKIQTRELQEKRSRESRRPELIQFVKMVPGPFTQVRAAGVLVGAIALLAGASKVGAERFILSYGDRQRR